MWPIPGGFKASLGVAAAVALGWSILGASVGLSGGVMIRSRERALYGLTGGALGGLFGGLMFNELSSTSIWSVLAGLSLLGLSIGAFISLVEETFVSAKVKVVKGRHIGREFPLLKEMNVVGRDDRSDVCLSGAEGVGIRHAYITKKDGRYAIEAEKEGTGVYVNQKLTRSSRLSDGDVIRVGSILLMFSAVKKAAAAALIAVVLSLPGALPASAAEPVAARISQFDLSGFPVVKTYVSVLDAAGRPASGLTKNAVSLTENGHPVAIEGMKMAGVDGLPEPVSFSIVLDRSESMAGEKIARAKESVLRFLSLMEPGDRTSLISFSDNVDLAEPLTGDRDRLQRATEAITAAGHTALFDAIAKGVESVKAQSGRRSVVVLTDGIANRGAFDMNQAIAEAVRENVPVYVIGLGRDVRKARLERIAEDTGGFYFFTPSAAGLSEIYDTISRRIRGEYILTYTTEKRADYLRKVSIALSTGQEAERTYFQPESSLFGKGGEAPGWAFAVSLASVVGLALLSLRTLDRKYATGHLSLVRGRGTRSDIDIHDGVAIGRDARSGLGLPRDENVDPHHAEVIQDNGRYVIEDKGSLTGTFVNNKKVTGRQMLEDGDVIKVGQATIVFSENTSHLCAACGRGLRQESKFCPQCGAKAA